MDELIFRALHGRASDAEVRRIEAWRQESAENERRYAELAMALEAATRAEPELSTTVPPAAALLQRAAVRAGAASERPNASPGARWWLLGAAAAAACLVIGIGIGRFPRGDTQAASNFGASEFVTTAGQTSTIALTDGSVVKLAPESRLRLLPDAGHDRAVELAGRAYFVVAKRPGQPFRVETAAGRVSVLGTRFDLDTHRGDLRVLVVEGRVELAAGGGTVAISAGQAGSVVGGRLGRVEAMEAASHVPAWTGGLLAFQATPLRVVAAELQQHYGTPVIVVDSAIADRTVTTWMTDQTLEAALSAICTATNARCIRQGGTWMIGAQGR